jgi:CDP-glycerol glycerophosphotransferase
MLTGRLQAARHPAVRDVSHHPEVAELYLAADAMVTDYSSTMFDFAVTGKPMIFFAYDLDHYRDVQRGFYFDFVPEAPGPLVTTSAEVFAVLHHLDEAHDAYAGRYAAFQERFCAWEDGTASRRVLERLGLVEPAAAS